MESKISLLAPFFILWIVGPTASQIVVREADTVSQDTLQSSVEVINLSVSPRIVVEYSNSTYNAYLSNVPTALADLTKQLPSTRRLVINYAASSYILPLIYASMPVGVEETEKNNIPDEFMLFQNYPNPFNPITSIKYFIPKASNVKISIYDLRGTLIKTLVNQEIQPGFHKIQWNASDVGSGVYIYQIEAGGFREVKKCVFIK